MISELCVKRSQVTAYSNCLSRYCDALAVGDECAAFAGKELKHLLADLIIEVGNQAHNCFLGAIR